MNDQSSGVEYLPGGVDSGFNKMEKDVFRTRLLHVKGKRVVRVSEVRTTRDLSENERKYSLKVDHLYWYCRRNAHVWRQTNFCVVG